MKLTLVGVAIGALAVAFVNHAAAETWRVQSGASISAVIATAAPGDTVLLAAGEYRESGIEVDKALTIIGPDQTGDRSERSAAADQRHAAIIDGGGLEIMRVVADDVTIESIVLRNVGVSYMEDRAGIRIAEASNCRIVDCRLEDAFFALYLENAGNTMILNNTIVATLATETTSGNGIHAWHCRGLTIEDNVVTGHRDGIYLEFVEESRIANNRSTENLRYGLHFMFSHDDVYEDNVFARNGAGVAVMFSDRVQMVGNRFEHNWGPASYGLLLKDIRDSEIAHNRFTRNTIGVYSEGSIRIDVHHNEFRSNGYAFKMMASSTDCSIRANNFVANTFDVATNSRQNFNTFVGNYWSRYQGYDLNRDGIGDVPHRPVHLFSLMVEREPAGMILMRSFFIELVDAVERAIPLYTPATLFDAEPALLPIDISLPVVTSAAATGSPAASCAPAVSCAPALNLVPSAAPAGGTISGGRP